MKFLIKEMTPQLWKDLERLFGEKGACGGCWCMWWRIEKGEEWKNIKGPEAKNRLRTMIENGTVRGLLAYDGSEPIGWGHLGERNHFSRPETSPNLEVGTAGKKNCVPRF